MIWQARNDNTSLLIYLQAKIYGDLKESTDLTYFAGGHKTALNQTCK